VFASRQVQIICMDCETTPDEAALFNDITAHGASLWEKSRNVEGLNTDPKMFSIMLFRRLWSNHRGYALLWNNRLQLESDIILRSGIEASICLAANYVMRERFVALMHRDAAFTLQGQIKTHRDAGELEMVRECEDVLRGLQAGLPPGIKAAKLDWKGLAEEGSVPHLYAWYRMLSGLSSHVTGASVLTGVATDDENRMEHELPQLQRKMHLMMMAGATLHGSMRHAGMLEDEDEVRASVALISRLNEVSKGWPGAVLTE